MKKIEIRTIVFEYQANSPDLPAGVPELIDAAKKAALHSYSPYSGFHVGAAVRLEGGKIIAGNNQENAAYPSGLCAERVALFAANSQFPETPVQALALSAFNGEKFTPRPVPPCGACLQVILETQRRFNKPILLVLAGSEKIQIIKEAASLLPLNFDRKFLKNKEL